MSKEDRRAVIATIIVILVTTGLALAGSQGGQPEYEAHKSGTSILVPLHPKRRWDKQ